MGILAGPFVVAALLLAVGGLLKAVRPGATERALAGAGLGAIAPFARLLGLAELVVGVAALALASRAVAALVAACYAGFAAFVMLSWRAGRPDGGCGCFGESDSPPTVLHAVLNAGAAVVAAAVAAGSGGGLGAALRHQPLAGVPFLALVAVCAGLAYAVLAVLPRTLAAGEGR